MPLNVARTTAGLCASAALVVVAFAWKRRRTITFKEDVVALPVPCDKEWWRLSAADVVDALREGRVSPEQLILCMMDRIASTKEVNAVVTTCAERALARAAAFAQAGGAPGPLHGLPVLVKDNHPIEGVRCTSGARQYADRIAAASHPIVLAIEASGGVVLGLSNTPEFAAGSHTFNDVFGTTLNPFDLSRTVGGSSGGSTAALAVGAAWLATGTDLGGSLRNPAACCGVVGLRPCPGRCPMPEPGPHVWEGTWGLGLHSVSGPLGRTVEDVALGGSHRACILLVRFVPRALVDPVPLCLCGAGTGTYMRTYTHAYIHMWYRWRS